MSENEPNQQETERPRSILDIESEIRDLYFDEHRIDGFAMETAADQIRFLLDISKNWDEFAQKQKINILKIEPGSYTEKIMRLVKEYYEHKAKSERQ